MSTTELTCQELVELVTDYFEGALSREEQLAHWHREATLPRDAASERIFEKWAGGA